MASIITLTLYKMLFMCVSGMFSSKVITRVIKRVIVQNTFSAIYMVQSKQGDKIFQVPTI